MIALSQGGNGPVEGGSVDVTVDWAAPSVDFDIDPSAYLLTEAGRVRGDEDMVFYNQPSGAEGGVRLTLDKSRSDGVFAVDLLKLPASITKVVFCLTINDAAAKRQTFGQLGGAGLVVRPTGGGELSFRPALAGAAEAALILGELYRRNAQWKFRAVGQGFNGGLGPLARSFGIEVADQPAQPPPAPSPTPSAAPPVSLSKVTLEKKGQSVSLEKRGASFGEIVVNLNWSRAKRGGGMFGGGAGGAVDLDLGCLFELQDGYLGVVQAIGSSFGAFDSEPFIELSGDDRTGDVAQGETIRINGARWSEIRRVAVFALIYEGAPNWQATDGVVLVTMPGQAPIEVRMTEGRNDRRLCGVVLLENTGGQLKATRIVDYFRDQRELDRAHGWGLRWAAGGKD